MKKGFTLIELVIVIAIIGILASIVLVGLGGFRGKSRDARRISDLKQVQNALELYFAKEGVYPSSNNWDDLANVLINATIGINQVPDDPVNSPTNPRHYGYCSENGSRYVLGAILEDGNNSALKQTPNRAFEDACGPGVASPMTVPNNGQSSPSSLCSTVETPTDKYCVTL
ncbi:MAG: type II secretion system protein [bacterium]|nr:type II secretion system protein [bacterium]